MLRQCTRCASSFVAEKTSGLCPVCLMAGAASAAEGAIPVVRPAYSGPQSIGRYRILEKIGHGGMGIVYKAEQRQPVRRIVALKVIKLGMDTKEVVARFETERQALAMLSHPNVAKVFEAGMTESGRPYFAMEFVPGVPLTEFCDQEKLTTKQRLELFIPVCHAVQHAHQKGIIHRDLKPGNVLVTLIDPGGPGVPKLIDFGIAKATNQALAQHTLSTQTGSVVGTPEYMSPEQAMTSGLDVDTHTDIYSLGVILYELLTGTLPLDPKTLREAGPEGMARIIKESEPPKPSTRLSTIHKTPGGSGDGRSLEIARRRRCDPRALRREVRGDLDWIVLKAMDKNRSRRYKTANDLATDIRRHLESEPVLARPPSTTYRLQKALRRHRLAFTAGGAVAAALVLGTMVSTWQAVRATRATRNADALRHIADQNATRAISEGRRAEAGEWSAEQNLYASDMNLAWQALAQDNLGRAQELLDRHRPGPGRPDLRGWEWRYLWQQCQSDALLTLCQTEDRISALAVSQDGRRIAIAEDQGGRLCVWDLGTRRRIAQVPAGEGDVRAAAFSPREPLLAFSAETPLDSPYQCSVHLWDAQTQQMGVEVPLGGPCVGLAFSDDGQTLLTSAEGREGELTLWRVPDGRKLASYPVHAAYWLGTPFAATRNLSMAAVESQNNTIHLIELSTGKQRWSATTPEEQITALALSRDGKVLASGQGMLDSSIRLWDVATGKELGPPLLGHHAWISQVVFWPDGKTLASASADQTIRLWDISDPAKAHPRAIPRILLPVCQLPAQFPK